MSIDVRVEVNERVDGEEQLFDLILIVDGVEKDTPEEQITHLFAVGGASATHLVKEREKPVVDLGVDHLPEAPTAEIPRLRPAEDPEKPTS